MIHHVSNVIKLFLLRPVCSDILETYDTVPVELL